MLFRSLGRTRIGLLVSAGDAKYALFQDIVRKTAKFVARDFPEVDWEDLFQDVMLEVLSNDKIVSPEDDHISTGLYRIATEHAWEYRKQALYISPQYSYRTSDIRKILETAFNPSAWDSSFLPDDARSMSQDDRLVINSDIKRGMNYLPPDYVEALFKRYALKESTTKGSAAEKVLQRATERLTDVLNFYVFDNHHEGPGSRRAITNANARYIISNQD